jgi:DNA excision repair protein ERCC-2
MARKGGVFTVSQIRKLGSFLGVCPFEMVMELTEHADAVACDYNQVFSERARLDSLFGKPGSPARLQLIVDEAHNLPGRMRALASPELSPMAVPGDASPHHILFFQKTNEAVRRLCIWLAHAAGRGRHTSNAGPADKSHEPGLTSALEIPLSHGAAEAMDRFRLEVAAYYAKVQRAIRDQAFDDPARMRMQDIETFCQTIQTESFGKEHPFSLTLEQGAGRSVLRILCKDSAHVLAGCIRPLAAPLFMSATLEPTEYFARSLGLKESPSVCILRQGTPFPAEHRRLFIVPQVSSVFRLRRLQIPKIAQVIGKILDLQGVNTFVFSPSFGFAAELLQSCPVPAHCDVHLQTPRMSPAALETLLEGFRSSNRPQVLFGVMRGSLSEGIDLPGRALQSVIVVGPALPPVSLEQDLLEAYETAHGNNGFDQASIIPAMIHVNQALGRLIRTPTDVGTCFLLDRRFTEQPYFDRLAKEWRHEDPAKHVSQALAQDISHFWESVSGVSQTLSSPLELR